MGSSSKTDKADKKERKEKKRSETDGISKASKKDKKDKKDKKEKLAAAVAEHLNTQETPKKSTVVVPVDENGEVKKMGVVPGNLLPIARPIADDKATKKILKAIRKAAKNNALKRGVKEVTKTIRKSPTGTTTGPGVVILAGDIWPMDVISHLPIACEDHSIPYIYVRSRAELGDSAATKRPTSVVMLTEKPGKKAKKAADEDEDEDGDSYADRYKGLVKLVEEEMLKQAFW